MSTVLSVCGRTPIASVCVLTGGSIVMDCVVSLQANTYRYRSHHHQKTEHATDTCARSRIRHKNDNVKSQTARNMPARHPWHPPHMQSRSRNPSREAATTATQPAHLEDSFSLNTPHPSSSHASEFRITHHSHVYFDIRHKASFILTNRNPVP